MSEKSNDKTQKAAPAVFSKRQILTFRRYVGRQDLLSVLLEEGKPYTLAQVDSLVQKFMEGKVR